MTVKSYPPEIDELIARCLAGESSEQEYIQLKHFLAKDADLKTDYEILKLLMFNKCEETAEDIDLKNKFNRLSSRLEDEGLS